MKRFHFKADIEFEAYDIDQAFDKLATHFRMVNHVDEDDGCLLDYIGLMRCKPIDDKEAD